MMYQNCFIQCLTKLKLLKDGRQYGILELPIALDTASCPLTLQVPQSITQPPAFSILSRSS